MHTEVDGKFGWEVRMQGALLRLDVLSGDGTVGLSLQTDSVIFVIHSSAMRLVGFEYSIEYRTVHHLKLHGELACGVAVHACNRVKEQAPTFS